MIGQRLAPGPEAPSADPADSISSLSFQVLMAPSGPSPAEGPLNPGSLPGEAVVVRAPMWAASGLPARGSRRGRSPLLRGFRFAGGNSTGAAAAGRRGPRHDLVTLGRIARRRSSCESGRIEGMTNGRC